MSSDCIKKLSRGSARQTKFYCHSLMLGNWIALKWNSRFFFRHRCYSSQDRWKASINKFPTPPHLQTHFHAIILKIDRKKCFWILANLDFVLNIFLANTFRPPHAHPFRLQCFNLKYVCVIKYVLFGENRFIVSSCNAASATSEDAYAIVAPESFAEPNS